MDATTFLSQLEGLYELDAGSLNTSMGIEDIPGWSSLSFLGLILMVDEEYQIALPPSRVQGCRTIEDLLRLIATLSEATRKAA